MRKHPSLCGVCARATRTVTPGLANVTRAARPRRRGTLTRLRINPNGWMAVVPAYYVTKPIRSGCRWKAPAAAPNRIAVSDPQWLPVEGRGSDSELDRIHTYIHDTPAITVTALIAKGAQLESGFFTATSDRDVPAPPPAPGRDWQPLQ